MNTSTKLAIAGAGVGLLAYVIYKAVPKVGQAVGDAAQAINPTNPDNVAATAVNKVGQIVSGDSSWSLGGWLYDLTHTDPLKDVSTPGIVPQSASQTRYNRPPTGNADTYDTRLYRTKPPAVVNATPADVNPYNPWNDGYQGPL